ncbi:U3 small nucleolar RNA-associated protein 15 [Rhizina undulata]
MAAPVTRIQPTKLPTLPASTTPEQRYWRSFKSPLLIHEYASVTSINFAAITPHDFAITSSTLIKIFSSKTRSVSKTISRFKDIAYSGHIRPDGKALVAGDATGLIQVFNLSSRAILRTWDEHKQPVHVTKFSPTSLTTVLSASDDSSVRLWDLPTGKSTNTFLGHDDYVRAAAFLPGSAATMVVSGGYDGTVRVWDPRASEKKGAVMNLTHESPVDAVLPMPGATTILAASGPVVQVWDVVAARPLSVLANHQKTVTALTVSAAGEGGMGRRVITGGLDGHVKIYDPVSWKVVYGVKYPAPILSVGVSPDEKHMAVGMVGGLLSIRTRTSGKEKVKEREKEKVFDMIAQGIDPITGAGAKKKSSTYARKIRGMDFKGEGVDVVAEADGKRKKERAWERNLRKGRYWDALDAVLNTNTPPITTFTLLNELKYRNATRAALMNRDEVTLQPVLKWLIKHIADPRYVDIIVDVALSILDMYSHALGQSPEFDRLIKRLYDRVTREIENSKQACQTKGMLGMLLAVNE